MSLNSNDGNHRLKRITISELAKLAGKTPATVSRSLRGKTGVSGEVSQQILELASRYGYVPNQAARNLVKGQSQFIGFLASDLSNISYLHTFRMLEKGSRSHGYSLLIADSEQEPELEHQHTEYFLKLGVAGMFIFPVSDLRLTEQPRYFDLLKTHKVPAVAFGQVAIPRISTVISEEWLSACNLIATLAEFGHRNFVLVAEDVHFHNIPAKMRLGAMQSAITSLPGGRICDVIHFRSENWTQRVIDALRQKSAPPTAVVTINDLMALQLYLPLGQAGFAVPEQVSIAAFGNNDWAEFICPALTLSEADEVAVAKTGLSILMDKINDPDSPTKHLTIPQKISVRASLGKARTD